MSVATTRTDGCSSAIVIAMPLPVPTSRTSGGRGRAGSGRIRRARQRFLDDELGFGPRDEDVGVTRNVRPKTRARR
jgi:hypothetical protein